MIHAGDRPDGVRLHNNTSHNLAWIHSHKHLMPTLSQLRIGPLPDLSLHIHCRRRTFANEDNCKSVEIKLYTQGDTPLRSEIKTDLLFVSKTGTLYLPSTDKCVNLYHLDCFGEAHSLNL